jgi:hypothetical protein
MKSANKHEYVVFAFVFPWNTLHAFDRYKVGLEGGTTEPCFCNTGRQDEDGIHFNFIRPTIVQT